MGFKEEAYPPGELFSDFFMGRGFSILLKPFMIPENSRLSCDTETPLTFEQITCSLEVDPS